MKRVRKPVVFAWIVLAGLVSLGDTCGGNGKPVCDCNVDEDCPEGHECDVPTNLCAAEGGIGGLCVPKIDGEIETPSP